MNYNLTIAFKLKTFKLVNIFLKNKKRSIPLGQCELLYHDKQINHCTFKKKSKMETFEQLGMFQASEDIISKFIQSSELA